MLERFQFCFVPCGMSTSRFWSMVWECQAELNRLDCNVFESWRKVEKYIIKGSWQVPLAQRCARSGLYSWKVKSSGLYNAPSHLSAWLNCLLNGTAGSAAFWDDLDIENGSTNDRLSFWWTCQSGTLALLGQVLWRGFCCSRLCQSGGSWVVSTA